MIDLYAVPTPNTVEIPILLEELGAAYAYHNKRQGEQQTPEFLKLNPNGKVPVIVDRNGPDGRPFTLGWI